MHEKRSKKLKEKLESGGEEEEKEGKPVEMTMEKISKEGSMKIGFN